MPIKSEKFFEERSDQSEIKARIVEKYFRAWANVIISAQQRYGRGNKLGFIDLYAGPGRYRDGAASTPLLVLSAALENKEIAARLVTIFNDGDKNHTHNLQTEIEALEGIEGLKYKPVVINEDVGEDLAQYFEKMNLIPSFSFVDPFGYKGLSLKIVNAFIKDWGSDCIFFFNYNRINAGICNPLVDHHMRALFGDERTKELQTVLPGLNPDQREAVILEALAHALRDLGGTYVLPFRFRNATGNRTSHCLVFVSKHRLGYEIMKDIMARESSVRDQGVPSFTYSPADERTPLLFSLSRPLDALEDMLLKDFSGQELPMRKIYEAHHVDKPYIESNYKDALRALESKGKIETFPPREERRKRKGEVTFGPKVIVRFPRAGGRNGNQYED